MVFSTHQMDFKTYASLGISLFPSRNSPSFPSVDLFSLPQTAFASLLSENNPSTPITSQPNPNCSRLITLIGPNKNRIVCTSGLFLQDYCQGRRAAQQNTQSAHIKCIILPLPCHSQWKLSTINRIIIGWVVINTLDSATQRGREMNIFLMIIIT